MHGIVLALCVCVGACAVVAREAKFDKNAFVPRTPGGVTHYIYPWTGRLFHSDYVRDNKIFQSLERTNFMRRGPLATRTISGRISRGSTEDEARKKHIYVDSEKIPVIETKKGFLKRDIDLPLKAVLLKVRSSSSKETQKPKRNKREISKENSGIDTNDSIKDDVSESAGVQSEVIASVYKTDTTKEPNTQNENKKEESIHINTENKVEEDHNPHVKNNDTDKTLFVHDTTPEEQIPKAIRLQEEEKDEIVTMRKTVVDDSMKLYPVYKGVNYHVPVTERRLLYSPKLMVQMDLPIISETVTRPENNGTEEVEVQGRSRRPLKKLAFPLLLALKLKTAIMLPLILGLISLISFKGLWSGLTALGIAAALGLKALVAGSTKVLVQGPHLPPPHYHHFPPHEITEYWSRRGEEYNDYRPNSWS